jgi:hypothetical protein
MSATGTVVDPDVAASRPLFRRIWGAPLWAHGAALALLLAVVLPFMSPTSSFTSDEGAYALQQGALKDGGWAYDYPAAQYDPDGRFFPLNQADRGTDGFYPYVKHPAYPLLLRGSVSVFGETVGLHLPALLGVLGAAIAAWLLAAELDPRLRRAAFWLAASSPVLVNGYILWAHALSAALAGLALVCAVRLLRSDPERGVRGFLLPAAGAAACLVAGVLVRSESLLFAGAVATAVAALQLRRAGLWRAMATFAVLAGPAAIVELAERTWVRSIVGEPVGGLGVRGGTSSFLSGRVQGAWHELFQGHLVNGSAGVPVVFAMALAVGLGYLALRRWSQTSSRDLTVAIAGATVLYLLRLRWYPMDPITGLFAAWPVALLGLLLVRWRRSGPVIPVLGVATALFTAAVVATQYAEGGGADWGGRFFSPLTVPLAVLAVAGLDRALAAAPRARRGRMTGLVAALAAVTAVVGLASVGYARQVQDRMVAAVARHPAPVTVTTFPGLPRVAWRSADTLTWMYAEDKDLPELLQTLHGRGVEEVAVVAVRADLERGTGSYRIAEEAAEPDLSGLGMSLLILRR